MWSEALQHGFGRVASAAGSFLLFALVARYCAAEDAKAIYFFAFSFGFLVAALRAFGTTTAGLDGRASRARKLRRVLAATGQLVIVQAAAVVAAVLALRPHPVSGALVGAAALVVALCAFDADLLRAALGRRSTFSLVFASGSALAIAAFLLAPARTVGVGCGALVLQWLPVAATNVYAYARIARRGRLRRWVRDAHAPAVLGATIVSAFDGLVLNAPFLLADRVGTSVGFDLSVATRLFVSSLPLVPLVVHWSNSGRLAALAGRVGVGEERLFSAAVAVSGAGATLLLAALYAVVSGKRATALQCALALGLLATYAFYAPSVRYGARHLTPGRKALFAALLAAFWAAYLVATAAAGVGAAHLVALEVATLAAGAIVLTSRSRAACATTVPVPGPADRGTA